MVDVELKGAEHRNMILILNVIHHRIVFNLQQIIKIQNKISGVALLKTVECKEIQIEKQIWFTTYIL